MTSFKELGVIVEDVPCCKCGLVTRVVALGFGALPRIDTFVGSCCRRYRDA